MARIHRPVHQPLSHNPQPPKALPSPPEPAPVPERAAAPTPDSFLKTTLRQVYESTPLVMLCTKPDLRELASKIPVVKEVADAVCPTLTGLDPAAKR